MKAKGIRDTIRALILSAALFFPPASACGGQVTVSAAASMRDAVEELSDLFLKKHPGVTLLKNTGSSGALAKQIEKGAPSDIFISANLEWMDYLKEKGLIEEKNTAILAYNALVFIGRPDPGIKTLKDLARLERIAIGSPKSAPAGQYAMAALAKAGVSGQIEKKLVIAKDVLECLMYAERGEADGAFVYRTDAMGMSDRVQILFDVPDDLYPRVTCPVGLTAKGADNEDARAFFEFLQTQESKTVLLTYGFTVE